MRKGNLLKKGLNRRATPLGRPYNSGSRRGNPMWLPVFFNKLPVFFNKLPVFFNRIQRRAHLYGTFRERLGYSETTCTPFQKAK